MDAHLDPRRARPPLERRFGMRPGDEIHAAPALGEGGERLDRRPTTRSGETGESEHQIPVPQWESRPARGRSVDLRPSEQPGRSPGRGAIEWIEPTLAERSSGHPRPALPAAARRESGRPPARVTRQPPRERASPLGGRSENDVIPGLAGQQLGDDLARFRGRHHLAFHRARARARRSVGLRGHRDPGHVGPVCMDPRRSSSHVVEPGAQRVQILDQENLRPVAIRAAVVPEPVERHGFFHRSGFAVGTVGRTRLHELRQRRRRRSEFRPERAEA